MVLSDCFEKLGHVEPRLADNALESFGSERVVQRDGDSPRPKNDANVGTLLLRRLESEALKRLHCADTLKVAW